MTSVLDEYGSAHVSSPFLTCQSAAPKHHVPFCIRCVYGVLHLRRLRAFFLCMFALQAQHPGTCVDPHLPDLLRLPAGAALHAHPLVADGSVVLQGKSSCMPAHALAPKPGWTVVDCCAAPGNKTTHLAAVMQVRNGGSKGSALFCISSRSDVFQAVGDLDMSRLVGAFCMACVFSLKQTDHYVLWAGRDLKQFVHKLLGTHALSARHNACDLPALRSLAACIAKGRGCVFALDKDATRLQRLRDNAQRVGADGCVRPLLQDFLSLDTAAPEYAQVSIVCATSFHASVQPRIHPS